MSDDRLQPVSSSWALSIPSVLEYVLKLQNKKDLMACRLVCKSWAKEAGRILGNRLNKQWITLDQLESLKEIQKCVDIALPLQMLLVSIPCGYNISKLSDFSYSSVKSLTLQCCHPFVPHILLKLFPNLESFCYLHHWDDKEVFLEVSSADVWDQCTLSRLRNIELHLIPEPSMLINWWSKLVEKAVKLESLDLYYMDNRTVDTLILKVFSPNFKSLTSVYGLFYSEAPFVALCTHPINFPLETIKLVPISNTISKLDMKLLLTRYSATLSELLLHFDKTFEMDFPLGVRMKKLQKLEIVRFRGSMEWKNLPQLKKLNVKLSHLEKIASSISFALKFCHLEVLKIADAMDEKEKFVTIFREIAEQLGPQLKSLWLTYGHSEALLPVIFDKLTQLHHLTLWGSVTVPPKITNINLCGGDFTFRRPREEMNGPPLKTLYKRMIASARKSNHARGPNITNLKDLQFLSLNGSFNEVAVLHGIIHCEKLRELNLGFPDDGTTRDSIVHLLVSAGLEHLTTVKLNGERINHLSFTPKAP